MFRDRKDAGRQLARALEAYGREAPVVLGLPRGGVVVANEVAQALGAPLDVVVVRKVGAPDRVGEAAARWFIQHLAPPHHQAHAAPAHPPAS